MPSAEELLAALIGRTVVIDTAAPYVILGTMTSFDEHHVTLEQVDVHDLRDTNTTRENYIVDSIRHGIRSNRRRALVARREIVCVSSLEDVLV